MKLKTFGFQLITVLIYVLLVSACATVRESYAPDGRKAYALNCSGTARGWDKCLTAAGEKCGSAGYDVLDRSSEESGVVSAVANSQGAVAHASKSNERSMLIACKVK